MSNALRTKLSPTPGRKADEVVIASTPKSTPWRVLMVGPTAGSLIENNYLLLNLNPPCAIADTSWIQPGKAAWDWWSGSYAKDVDFEPGMNTATMKHYIDFAAAQPARIHAGRRRLVSVGKSRAVGRHLELSPRGEHPRNHRLRQAEGRQDTALGRLAAAEQKDGRGVRSVREMGRLGRENRLHEPRRPGDGPVLRSLRSQGGRASADGRFPRGLQGNRPAAAPIRICSPAKA